MGYVIFWVVTIILSIAVEAATLNLTSIWFAAGALAALIVLTLGGSFILQLIAFAIAAAVLLILVRPMTRHLLRPKGARTNADRIVGELAIVTEEIDNAAALGAIKIFGLIWSARSADNTVIPIGETVQIRAISGVKAMVERVGTQKEAD